MLSNLYAQIDEIYSIAEIRLLPCSNIVWRKREYEEKESMKKKRVWRKREGTNKSDRTFICIYSIYAHTYKYVYICICIYIYMHICVHTVAIAWDEHLPGECVMLKRVAVCLQCVAVCVTKLPCVAVCMNKAAVCCSVCLSVRSQGTHIHANKEEIGLAIDE